MNRQQIQLLKWILRIGTALTFTGHGLVALSVKYQWLTYLTAIGFTQQWAQQLLPLIGILDLLVAGIILLRAYQAVVLWAVGWAFLTALIRPIAGEGWLAFVERGANWAVPLTLYLIQHYHKDHHSKQNMPER